MPWSRLIAVVALATLTAGATPRVEAANAVATPPPKANPSPGPTEQAQRLLRESVLAPQTVSYVGQLETIRFSTSRATATIMRVEHLAPDRTRKWYLAPESLYGDYTITRGITTYEIDPKDSQIVTSRNPSLENQVVAMSGLSLINHNYRTELGDRDTIAGHPTISVVLINKYTGERCVRVWIDPTTALVLKKEQYRGNGSVASQSRFEDLRYTAQIPTGVFSTVVPAGYKHVTGRTYAAPSTDLNRVQKDAGFKAIIPKYLPQGFTVMSGDDATVNQVKTMHFLYSDGLRNLSLFENATGAAADFGKLKPHTVRFENHDAQYVEDGPTTLLTWQERSIHFALVGDLTLRDLVEIAISVVP